MSDSSGLGDTASVINLLADCGAESLLEVVSLTTGWPVSAGIGRRAFAKHLRLTYAASTHRTFLDQADRYPSIESASWQIEAMDSEFDVVFVDPWHSVADSLRLVLAGLRAVRPGGLLIVHDCHPRDEVLRKKEPAHLSEAWCGETWKVWQRLTSVLSPTTNWRTLDIDHGIGVLAKPRSRRSQVQLFQTIRRLTRHQDDWSTDLEWAPSPSHLNLSASLSLCDMMSR